MANQKVSLLSDTPADRDEFKSHEKVAEAITTLISSGESGGMAIAITGSWGSGKSTVIEIVKRKLDESAELAGGGIKTLVFQFDAWTHQDDPPRRAFLESLLDFLLSSVYALGEGKRLGEKWKQEINKITGKSETSTTTTLKQITPAGALIALLLLVTLPLASSVATKTNLWWGIVFVCLPILVAIIAAVLDRRRRGQETIRITEANSDGDKPGIGDQLLRALLRDTQEVKTADTEKAGDATSTEFRIVFNKMMNELLTRQERRLVIVVDNLDRVEAEKAVSIWSTMRIFFELDARPCPWKSKFWLIAPFDPSALKKLWTSDESGDDAAALVESFINKTFQVTFRVSPPVFARWRDFFRRNFKDVFKEKDIQEEWQVIYRLYDRYNPHPSFRDIKLFLNKLAVLYLQWENRIPLPVLALHILVATKEGDKMLEGILGRQAGDAPADAQPPPLIPAAVFELLQDARGQVEPDDWKKQIAAVHFNVEPDEVVHVLIGNELQQAITSGDAVTIKRLAKVPDFWIACERVIEDRLPDLMGKPELLTTLRLLYEAEPYQQDGASAANRVMEHLVKRAAELIVWDLGAVPLVNELVSRTGYPIQALFRQNVLSAASKVPETFDDIWAASVCSALNSLEVQTFNFETDTAGSLVRATHLLIKAGAPSGWAVSLADPALSDSIPEALINYAGVLKCGEMKPLVDRVITKARAELRVWFRKECIAQIGHRHKEVPVLIEAALSVPVGSLRKQREVLDSLGKPVVALGLLPSSEPEDWMARALRCVALFTTSPKWGESYSPLSGQSYHKILERMASGEAGDLYEAFLSAVKLVNVEAMLLAPGLEEPSTRAVAARAIADLSTTSEPRFRSAAFVARHRSISKALTDEELSAIIASLVKSSDLLEVLCRRGRILIGHTDLYRSLLRTPARERLLSFLLQSILAARPQSIVGALQRNAGFQSLFAELLDAAGPAWLSPELAAALLELGEGLPPSTEPAGGAAAGYVDSDGSYSFK